MPLVAGVLTHVYQSLDTYLTTVLLYSDGTPVALKLHGVRRFVPPPDAAWVEVFYSFLGLQQRFLNRLTRTPDGLSVIGTERLGYIQCNVYQRARVFSQRYSLAAARDLVVGVFPDGEVIPVYDASHLDTNPTPVLEGQVLVDGVQEHTLDVGMQSGVQQHIIQIATRYIELATRRS